MHLGDIINGYFTGADAVAEGFGAAALRAWSLMRPDAAPAFLQTSVPNATPDSAASFLNLVVVPRFNRVRSHIVRDRRDLLGQRPFPRRILIPQRLQASSNGAANSHLRFPDSLL